MLLGLGVAAILVGFGADVPGFGCAGLGWYQPG
jgi:hypothetical protein